MQVRQDHQNYIFFDRGIPDTLAYIAMEGLSIEEELLHEAKGRRYHKYLSYRLGLRSMRMTTSETNLAGGRKTLSR
jgi:predicted ATPase